MNSVEGCIFPLMLLPDKPRVRLFSHHLIQNLFQVQPGEVVAITADAGAFHDIVFATARAVEEAG
ncbi:MAG: hypothetical protein AAF655_18475, partial [Bacteroidota bacterium]